MAKLVPLLRRGPSTFLSTPFSFTLKRTFKTTSYLAKSSSDNINHEEEEQHQTGLSTQNQQTSMSKFPMFGRIEETLNGMSHLPSWAIPKSMIDGTPINVRDSFSLNILYRHSVHVGKKVSQLHPNMRPYIQKVHNFTHIIDLDQTLVMLRRAVNVTREIAFRGGIILFVGTGTELYELTTKISEKSNQFRVVGKWLGGTLTNGKEGLGTDEYLPDLIIFLNPEGNEVATQEAKKMLVPSISICNTNMDPVNFTYPIPANDASIRSVTLIAEILANAILEGSANRHQVREETKAKMAKFSFKARNEEFNKEERK